MINRLEKILEYLKSKGVDVSAIISIVNKAKEKISLAKDLLKQRRYREALGTLVEARKIIGEAYEKFREVMENRLKEVTFNPKQRKNNEKATRIDKKTFVAHPSLPETTTQYFSF